MIKTIYHQLGNIHFIYDEGDEFPHTVVIRDDFYPWDECGQFIKNLWSLPDQGQDQLRH